MVIKKYNDSQFYFEYNMVAIRNDLNLDQANQPKLYVENDYRGDTSKYLLFLVLPEWLEPIHLKMEKDLLYENAKILYEHYGIDPSNVFELQEEYDISRYRKGEYSIPLLNDSSNLSGVGKIILTKGAKSTIYKFAVNFRLKSVIQYSIKKKQGKLLFNFKCDKSFDEVVVMPLYNENILPCFKDDYKGNSYDEIHIIPNIKGNYECSISIKENHYVYLTFQDRELSKYYVLECTHNETLPKIEISPKRPLPDKICPYCHRKINLTYAQYKEGSYSCQGKPLVDSKTLERKYITLNGKIVKKSIFCEEDASLDEDGYRVTGLQPDTARLLPDKYIDAKSYKIAILGSKRAGKSTYISRFFEVSSDQEETTMSLSKINAKIHDFAKVNSYIIKEIKNNQETAKPWYKGGGARFYGSYSISSYPRKIFPAATDRDNKEVMRKPFIIVANQNNYLSFYDIAGEDAQQGRETVGKLTTGTSTGIFFLVDGIPNEKGSKEVESVINANFEEELRDCPLAIILTKFDTLKDKFDDNAMCLRTNLGWYKNSKFEGSPLETMIHISSEEIKSYLSKNNIIQDRDLTMFKNRKYFCVSSFSTGDAVYHLDQDKNQNVEINALKFKCSTERMELPFLWMMKQLGIII